MSALRSETLRPEIIPTKDLVQTIMTRTPKKLELVRLDRTTQRDSSIPTVVPTVSSDQGELSPLERVPSYPDLAINCQGETCTFEVTKRSLASTGSKRPEPSRRRSPIKTPASDSLRAESLRTESLRAEPSRESPREAPRESLRESILPRTNQARSPYRYCQGRAK